MLHLTIMNIITLSAQFLECATSIIPHLFTPILFQWYDGTLSNRVTIICYLISGVALLFECLDRRQGDRDKDAEIERLTVENTLLEARADAWEAETIRLAGTAVDLRKSHKAHLALGILRHLREPFSKQIFGVRDAICVICQADFEVGEPAARLDCGHAFHVACLVECIPHSTVCSVCRHEIQDSSEVQLVELRAMKDGRHV